MIEDGGSVSDLKPVVGLDDVFGIRAKKMRQLQALLFQLFDEHGYQEVIPPLVERPESLMAGAGRFLSDQTLVFPDPAGAGLLAIRPDMTPQIARIAATRMQQEACLKLCYSGPVLQSRPHGHMDSRQQWQMGVEALGLSSDQADFEVIYLAALCMQQAGLQSPLLQIGHIGLLHALVEPTHIEDIADLLMRRSPDDFNSYCATHNLPENRRILLLDMIMGVADQTWLRKYQHTVNGDFAKASGDLIQLYDALNARLEGSVKILLDAALMPRFLYHSGVIFAGYAYGSAEVILHGGRYDDMMSAHGRSMAATGFSFDLWRWLDVQ
ncbi:MAG: ATP phosphoribosyltransferase regulatory subunit [Zetaproteobacteria bacterium]|nr:ATP phosphoribosyltransferase regulatory subunit [Zetaproteobacteria bacterium]